MKYAWITRASRLVSRSRDVRRAERLALGLLRFAGARRRARRAERHERIQQAVEQVHAESHGIYGSDKVAEELQRRDDLETACRNTVAAAMREMGLKSRVCKRV